MHNFADLVPYWASGGVCRTRACRTMACRTRACQTRARLSNEGLSNGGLSNEGWPGGMCTLFCLGWPRAMGICSSFGCRVWANCTANILHGMSHAHSQTLYVGQVVRVLGPSGGKTLNIMIRVGGGYWPFQSYRARARCPTSASNLLAHRPPTPLVWWPVASQEKYADRSENSHNLTPPPP